MAGPVEKVERGATRLSEADHLKAALSPRVIVPLKDSRIAPTIEGQARV